MVAASKVEGRLEGRLEAGINGSWGSQPMLSIRLLKNLEEATGRVTVV